MLLLPCTSPPPVPSSRLVYQATFGKNQRALPKIAITPGWTLRSCFACIKKLYDQIMIPEAFNSNSCGCYHDFLAESFFNQFHVFSFHLILLEHKRFSIVPMVQAPCRSRLSRGSSTAKYITRDSIDVFGEVSGPIFGQGSCDAAVLADYPLRSRCVLVALCAVHVDITCGRLMLSYKELRMN